MAALCGRAAAARIGVSLTWSLLLVAQGMAFGAPPLVSEPSNPTNPSASVAASSVPEVHWNAPQDCPNEEQFRLRLGEYLGRDVPATTGTTAAAVDAPATADRVDSTTTVTAARIDVTRDAAEYRISLRVEQHGRWRKRALRTKSCAEALDASALVIALAIDPSVARRVPSNSGSGPSLVSVQAATVADPATHPDLAAQRSNFECTWLDSTEIPCDCPSPTPTPRVELVAARLSIKPRYASSERYALSVHSGAQLSYQLLPTVPLGVGLGVALDTSHLRLSVTALVAQAVARQGAKGGEFSLVRAHANACWISGGRLGIGPCAGMSLGALSGEGIGITVVQRANELWWSTTFGALLRYWHHDSAIAGAFTFVELPGRRPSFQLSGREFYRPPAVGLVGGVQLGLILN